MRKPVIVCCLLVISNFVFAQDWHNDAPIEERQARSDTSITLLLDRYLSPSVGAEALYSGVQLYKKLDDILLPSSEQDGSLLKTSLRLTKLLLLEFPFSSMAHIAQHEYFGHGARLREFHVPVVKYRIRPFEGAVLFQAAPFNQLHPHERMAIESGGMESNGILAKRLRDSWLENERLDSREALLYTLSNFDQTRYIMSTRFYSEHFPSGHDINKYTEDLNHWFGHKVTSLRRLRTKALLDYFDPYFYYSLYGCFHYVSTGSQQWQYPMLQFGQVRYLPALRLGLAPYGLEYQLHNYIRTPQHVMQAVLRYGKTANLQSVGLGFEMTQIFKYADISVDGKVHVWRQPKLFTANPRVATQTWGGAVMMTGYYPLPDWPSFQVMGVLGYKTMGFLPGETLKRSPIVKLGMRAFF